MVKKCNDMFNRFDRIQACDGQTEPDGQTDILRRHSTVCALPTGLPVGILPYRLTWKKIRMMWLRDG